MAIAAMGSHPAGISKTSLALSASYPAIWWTNNPRDAASTVSHALAAPTSYCALRLGFPVFANDNCATAKASTAAFFAQLALAATSTPASFAKFSASSLAATMYAQGCSLLLEGAQRAASNRLTNTSGATLLSLNARGLQRSAIIS